MDQGSLVGPRVWFWCEAPFGKPEECWHQCGCDADRDEDGKGGSDPHHAEEGYTDDEQPKERNNDCHSGEDYGASGSADGGGGRFLRFDAARQLVSMPRENKE